MNITFMVGNGFDRNLGLATTYAEFVKAYKQTEGATDNLKRFREYIKENEELWSAAEIALGLYTSQFGPGQAVAFSECHMDICEELARYLKKQQRQIDFVSHLTEVQKVFDRLNNLSSPFPTQEQTTLKEVLSEHREESRVFRFICFNYTDTLDRCIDVAKKHPEMIGSHRNGAQMIKHAIGEVFHVHGTVEKDMVFGVNDETQIGNNAIFDCDDGDLYRNLLIKQNANASYQENADAKAAKILGESQIIYIYGMSLGETDRLWWERVCQWLYASSKHHVIIQKYSMPAKGVFPINYQVTERKCRRELTGQSSLSASSKKSIENRIHITDDNIFDAIKDIRRTETDIPPTIETEEFDESAFTELLLS